MKRQPAFGAPDWSGCGDDARIEQGRRFERIFVQEIGADQLALDLGEIGMRGEGVFHLVGARLERLQQVAVPALEILEHIGQLAGDAVSGSSAKHPVDDVVGARLVGRD